MSSSLTRRKTTPEQDSASLITQRLYDKWTNVTSDTLITWIMSFSWEGDRISHRNNGYNINQVPNAQLLKKYDQTQYLITSYLSSNIKLSKIHVLSLEKKSHNEASVNVIWCDIASQFIVQSNFLKSRKSIFIKGIEFRKEIFHRPLWKKRMDETND